MTPTAMRAHVISEIVAVATHPPLVHLDQPEPPNVEPRCFQVRWDTPLPTPQPQVYACYLTAGLLVELLWPLTDAGDDDDLAEVALLVNKQILGLTASHADIVDVDYGDGGQIDYLEHRAVWALTVTFSEG